MSVAIPVLVIAVMVSFNAERSPVSGSDRCDSGSAAVTTAPGSTVQTRNRAYPSLGLGTHHRMIVLIILVVLAIVFGIGAVMEGLLWMFLIGAALLVAAIWFGWSRLRRNT